jgi:DNA polymerase-3 subunit epsilon
MAGTGIYDWRIYDTPIAVIDIETTGLSAGTDRVIELSIVHIDPGNEPKLVFDTLINPCRPVSATYIHNITDEDVVDAPRFEDISGEVIRLLYNRIVAAFNVYFDIKFLRYEFSRLGVSMLPPHICLMYLGCLAGLERVKNLSEVCRCFNIQTKDSHISAYDAIAAGKLWYCYLENFNRKGIQKFRDFCSLKNYKFMESFNYLPYMPPLGSELPCKKAIKSRVIGKPQSDKTSIQQKSPSEESKNTTGENKVLAQSRSVLINEYYECLKNVLSDLIITDEEIDYLEQKRKELGLTDAEVMSLHGFVFGNVLLEFTKDNIIDDRERATIAELYKCLEKLGWAPGQ